MDGPERSTGSGSMEPQEANNNQNGPPPKRVCIVEKRGNTTTDDDSQGVIGFDMTNNKFVLNGITLEDMSTDMDTAPNSSITATSTRKPRPPPLVVVNFSVSALQHMLNNIITSKKFELKLMRVGIKVQFTTNEDYKKAYNKLKEDGIHFYQYHNAETRQKKVVLYGLHKLELNDLKNELSTCNIYPDDIRQLNIKRPSYDHQAVYLLYFKANSVKLNDLRQVKSIANVIVRWDFYRPTKYNSVPQCRNCQMLGHSSVNCSMPPKCLVCGNGHKTENCEHRIPRAEMNPQIDRSYIKCANCGQQHTANYRGCAKRAAFIEAREAMNAKRHPIRKPTPKPFQMQDKHFPQLPSANTSLPYNRSTQHRQQTTTTSISWADMATSSSQDLLLSPDEMINFTMSLFSKLKSCKTKEQQLHVAMKAVMDFLYLP